MLLLLLIFLFFFFNDTATTEIYTLSLHDALPISFALPGGKIAVYTGIFPVAKNEAGLAAILGHEVTHADRKSTRLNSSHLVISYAVFCLKKKKKQHNSTWST